MDAWLRQHVAEGPAAAEGDERYSDDGFESSEEEPWSAEGRNLPAGLQGSSSESEEGEEEAQPTRGFEPRRAFAADEPEPDEEEPAALPSTPQPAADRARVRAGGVRVHVRGPGPGPAPGPGPGAWLDAPLLTLLGGRLALCSDCSG